MERDLFRERFSALQSPPFSPRSAKVLFRPVEVTLSAFCRLFPRQEMETLILYFVTITAQI